MASEALTHPAGNGQIHSAPPPPTEVVLRPKRRTFTAAYKHRILAEADQCTQPGQVGALLRREGLYSSHLVDWRRQRQQGQLRQTQRGKPAADPAVKEVARLQRENAHLRHRLAQAETIIAVQKKLSLLLGPVAATTYRDDAP
jgi:transposase